MPMILSIDDLRELAKKLPGTPNCFDMRQMKRRRKKELRAAATAAGELEAGGDERP